MCVSKIFQFFCFCLLVQTSKIFRFTMCMCMCMCVYVCVHVRACISILHVLLIHSELESLALNDGDIIWSSPAGDEIVISLPAHSQRQYFYNVFVHPTKLNEPEKSTHFVGLSFRRVQTDVLLVKGLVPNSIYDIQAQRCYPANYSSNNVICGGQATRVGLTTGSDITAIESPRGETDNGERVAKWGTDSMHAYSLGW